MDFPLLKTFEVEPWITESLLEFLEDLKINLPKNPYIEETAFSNLSDSYATDNLLDTDFPKLDIFSERGSDGKHPSKKHYKYWANQIKPYIDNF